jgi:hypothetical protein
MVSTEHDELFSEGLLVEISCYRNLALGATDVTQKGESANDVCKLGVGVLPDGAELGMGHSGGLK